MEIIEVKKSSNIAVIGYDEKSSTLLIGYKHGKKYHYYNVSAELYEEFKNVISKGQFYWAKIHGKYEYKEI